MFALVVHAEKPTEFKKLVVDFLGNWVKDGYSGFRTQT